MLLDGKVIPLGFFRGYYFVAAGAVQQGEILTSPHLFPLQFGSGGLLRAASVWTSQTAVRSGEADTCRHAMVTAESRWFCGPIGACSGPGPAAGYRSLQGAVPGGYDPLGRKSSTPGSWILLLLGNQRGAAACVGVWLSTF